MRNLRDTHAACRLSFTRRTSQPLPHLPACHPVQFSETCSVIGQFHFAHPGRAQLRRVLLQLEHSPTVTHIHSGTLIKVNVSITFHLHIKRQHFSRAFATAPRVSLEHVSQQCRFGCGSAFNCACHVTRHTCASKNGEKVEKNAE